VSHALDRDFFLGLESRAMMDLEKPQQTWRSFGYVMQFRWSEPSLESLLDFVVLPGWERADGVSPDAVFLLEPSPSGVSITRDQEPPIAVPLSMAGDELKRQAHMHLATYAPDTVFVHAGVVLGPTGLILLPGRSYAGKSTLVRALVKLGCRYYSDEFAIVHADGLVSPFPRDLSQRDWGNPDIMISPTDLGWTPDLGPSRVAAVVNVSYGNEWTWEVESIGAGTAMLRLFENTVSAQIAPDRALRYFPKMLENALCLSGQRGEVDVAAKALMELLNAQGAIL
jgi:hypothetical protein